MFNKKNEEEHNIWISFSDLYSGLMVIFIVISLGLAYKYKVDADKFKKIQSIQKTLDNLSKSGLFEYNKKGKRYEFKQEVNFPPNSDTIPEASKKALIRGGREIMNIIKALNSSEEIKFQIVVEGRAARPFNLFNKNINIGDHPVAEDLSYHRAKNLVQLWEQNNINLQIKGKSELYISGSGFGGQNRYEGKEEEKNRRFIIQIIPYIPNLEK